MPKGESGIRHGGDAGKYEKGVTYTATAPYKEGDYITGSPREYAENERGYTAVFTAETGSVVKVHYPEMFIYDRFIPGHDELYEVRQVVPDKFDSSTLRLSFRGSSSPNSQYESVHLATWRGWGAKNIQDVKEILGMGEKITIIPSGSVNWPKYAVNVKKTQGLQDYMPE